MAVKITFGEPTVVAVGPTWEEVHWGPYQFPRIYRMEDGSISVRYHLLPDDDAYIGSEDGWAISKDEGKSWQSAGREEIPVLKAQAGLRLPSGKYIRHCPLPNVEIDKELQKKLRQKDIPSKKYLRRCSVMLGKLIKNEFKTTWQSMSGVYMAAGITALLMLVFVVLKINAITVLGSIALIVIGLVSFIVTLIMTALNYYRSMFGPQGYLSMTLPVKSSQLFFSKAIVSMVP